MNITILGAGPGGFSFAADLYSTHPDFQITIAAYSDYSRNIESLNRNSLTVNGVFNFEYTPNVTVNVEEAIKSANIILLVVPAFAQKKYIEDIIKYGNTDQFVLFVPGNFAAFVMSDMIRKNKVNKSFYIAEVDTLPYASKFFERNELTIKQKKSRNKIAFFENYTDEIKEELIKLFPTFSEDPSIFKINLSNPAPPVHVASTLFNASRIEQEGPYETSSYDMTPSIANIIEIIDSERRLLAEHFGVGYTCVLDVLNEMYPSEYDNFYEFIINSKTHKRQLSPPSLTHRYITEEIPYHFVPIVLLAKKVKVPMPICESLIYIAGALNKEDYWSQGRDIRSLFKKK